MENKLLEDSNRVNLYAMLHEFRNWNRDWDLYMSRRPIDVDDFVERLSKKCTIIRRK
jgi:hypothetical protein